MHKLTLFLSIAASLLLAAACQKTNPSAEKIARLEAELEAHFSPEKTGTLLDAYKSAIKKSPGETAANFQYLLRGAKIQFEQLQDAVGTARWLDDALAHHAEGQNLTEAVALQARVWNTYIYKAQPAARLDPDDIDKMRAHLTKNTLWLDSALLRLDKIMTVNPANMDKAAAQNFIEIAESYADIARNASPDKFVNLTMKAGAVAKTTENFNKATSLYFSIFNQMPGHPKAPTALFMMGFIYENDLADLKKAKQTYEDFLKKYPDDKDYADDAQMALQNLGKSPEELIKEFEKNAKK